MAKERSLIPACVVALLMAGGVLAVAAQARLLQPIERLRQEAPSSAQPLQELDRLQKEGMHAYQRGDFPAAFKAFETGLAQAQSFHDEKVEARFRNALGNVYFVLDQYDRALDCYGQALQLREKLG